MISNGVHLCLMRSIESKMDCLHGLCPATQVAIDNLLSHHGHRSRVKLLQELKEWPAPNIRNALAHWYNENDILLITGRSRQAWLDAFDSYEKQHGGKVLG